MKTFGMKFLKINKNKINDNNIQGSKTFEYIISINN